MATKNIKIKQASQHFFEPRKPMPLGTMFRNGADCMSGVLVIQDVVQAPRIQSQKIWCNSMSSRHGLLSRTLIFSLCMHCIVSLLQDTVRNQLDIGLFFNKYFRSYGSGSLLCIEPQQHYIFCVYVCVNKSSKIFLRCPI